MDQKFLFSLFFPFCIFLFMFVKVWKRSKTHDSSKKLPPGPKKLPFIGNLHQFIGSTLQPHHKLRDLAKKYGPLMHLQLGEVSTVVVSSPDMAKEVLRNHDLNFATRPELVVCRITTSGFKDIVFAPYGDYWRQLRKICVMELLSANRVQSFRPIREEEVSNLVRIISSANGSVINLGQKILSMTSTILARAAFGEKCKHQEIFLAMTDKMTSLAGGFELSNVFPSLEFVFMITGMKHALERCHQKVCMILDDIINDHKEKRKANLTKNVDKRNEDLVDVLLRIQESGELEFPITTENIKAVILDIFIAGTETSSTTIEWAMAELMRAPRVMEKAQAEIRNALKGKQKVEETDIQELSYLKFVIKETLRLHPPVPLLVPRECRERCEIDGYEIPLKTRIMINVYAIGRDPKNWKDAHIFCPERFQDSSTDFKGSSFEYLPFGSGRRMCPGMIFGIANVELQLAELLYYFDWKLPGGISPKDVDMSELFGATIKKKEDLHLIATPRF